MSRSGSTRSDPMVSVNSQRLVAVVLFLIAFLALAASRAFPLLDDIPGVVETIIVVVGVVCGLAGVYLWLRRAPDSEA
jgi:hypothetical protein